MQNIKILKLLLNLNEEILSRGYLYVYIDKEVRNNVQVQISWFYNSENGCISSANNVKEEELTDIERELFSLNSNGYIQKYGNFLKYDHANNDSYNYKFQLTDKGISAVKKYRQ